MDPKPERLIAVAEFDGRTNGSSLQPRRSVRRHGVFRPHDRSGRERPRDPAPGRTKSDSERQYGTRRSESATRTVPWEASRRFRPSSKSRLLRPRRDTVVEPSAATSCRWSRRERTTQNAYRGGSRGYRIEEAISILRRGVSVRDECNPASRGIGS